MNKLLFFLPIYFFVFGEIVWRWRY